MICHVTTNLIDPPDYLIKSMLESGNIDYLDDIRSGYRITIERSEWSYNDYFLHICETSPEWVDNENTEMAFEDDSKKISVWFEEFVKNEDKFFDKMYKIYNS